MSALLDDTERLNASAPCRCPGIVPDDDIEARDGICPVCGSGNTYQTMDGRWGCTQCGSTWA